MGDKHSDVLVDSKAWTIGNNLPHMECRERRIGPPAASDADSIWFNSEVGSDLGCGHYRADQQEGPELSNPHLSSQSNRPSVRTSAPRR